MIQYLEYFQYRLDDLLHFRPRAYYRLFELYNAEIFPAQLLALLLGMVVLTLLWRGRAGRAAVGIVAAFWLWVGWGFLYRHLATIHLAGPLMAAGFTLQAALLAGVAGRGLTLSTDTIAGRIGIGLFLFALAVQPLIAPMLGRPLAQSELVGLAPDPTVVATLGIVLLAAERRAWLLLPLPVLWCVVQGTTLWLLRSPEAVTLPVAALIAVFAMIFKMRPGERGMPARPGTSARVDRS